MSGQDNQNVKNTQSMIKIDLLTSIIAVVLKKTNIYFDKSNLQTVSNDHQPVTIMIIIKVTA